jgi:hypothetical protein
MLIMLKKRAKLIETNLIGKVTCNGGGIMKLGAWNFSLFLIVLSFAIGTAGIGKIFAADNIVSVTPNLQTVDCFKPVFITILTTKSFSNGFNPDEIKLDCEITGPQGEAIVLPCFFKATVSSQGQWQARFAPRKVGTYTYKIALTQGGATTRSAENTLVSLASTNNGFIHPDTTTKSMYVFRFDSGKLWRGIGENIAWEAGGQYSTQFPRLAATGCNMVRMWHCNWHMPFEWNSAPNIYNTSTADYMDQVVTLAENNGIYLMVMMNDYRDMSEQWGNNPYNTSKGGWCSSNTEFFSNANAKACYKKRIRYYVARWGYSPNIQSWEFFNEIDNAFGTSINAAMGQWHDEMSQYFHTVDIYNHLVTSSISWQSIPQMWTPTGMDFTQAHLYGPSTSNPVYRLPAQAQQYITAYKKPYVCGEFSRRWEAANTEPSINYRHELHYGMYLGLVNPTPIAPLTWWWDSHWSWGDDFVFKSAAGFSNDIVAKAGSGTLMKLDVTASPSGVEFGGVKTTTSANCAYAWVTNYRGSASASNVTLTVTGLPTGNGQYSVEWYDTWNTGGFGSPMTVTSSNGTLTLNAGTLANGNNTTADKACRITSLNPSGVATGLVTAFNKKPFQCRVNAYEITVSGNFTNGQAVEVALYDLSGRIIVAKNEHAAVNNTIIIATGALPSQCYIVRVMSGTQTENFKIAL